MTTSAGIGFCFDRSFPPALVTDVARRLEAGGADRLWLIEDCFYTAGRSASRPAPSRSPSGSVSASASCPWSRGTRPSRRWRSPPSAGSPRAACCPDSGTACRTGWNRWASAPLTALEEVIVAVRRLLAGEEVTTDGKQVRLTKVKLDQPPAEVPPILAGVRGPKSLARAGKVADGLVLAEPATPSTVRAAVDLAGRPEEFVVAVFSSICVQRDRPTAYRLMAPWLADMVETRNPSLTPVPFFDDLTTLYADRGVDGLVGMPPEWWTEIGPIGTLDDAAAHLDALEAEGVKHIGLFPQPDVDTALAQLEHTVELANR